MQSLFCNSFCKSFVVFFGAVAYISRWRFGDFGLMGWIVVHFLKKCILFGFHMDSVSRSFLGDKVAEVMIEVARPWIENLGSYNYLLL